MIVYDPDSYAYAFETLDDYAPILCMYCAEYGSVKNCLKQTQITLITFLMVINGKRFTIAT